MNTLAGTILLLHAWAHLFGFFKAYRITADVPYPSPAVAARLHLGGRGIRLIGIIWMLIAVAFAVAGVGAIAKVPGWSLVALAGAVASVIMCLLDWMPETKTGIEVDVALIAALSIALWGEVPLVEI